MATTTSQASPPHLPRVGLLWLGLVLALISGVAVLLWWRYGAAIFSEMAIAALNMCF